MAKQVTYKVKYGRDSPPAGLVAGGVLTDPTTKPATITMVVETSD